MAVPGTVCAGNAVELEWTGLLSAAVSQQSLVQFDGPLEILRRTEPDIAAPVWTGCPELPGVHIIGPDGVGLLRGRIGAVEVLRSASTSNRRISESSRLSA